MNRICVIEFSYPTHKIVKELSPEKFAEFREIVLNTPEKQADVWLHGQHLIYSDDLPKLTEMGFIIEVKNFKGNLEVEKWAGVAGIKSTAVHVHIPNIGLLYMTEVMVLEDACTDKLQSHLDEGWRILCVCPPNSQRRPDYILGRAKEK